MAEQKVETTFEVNVGQGGQYMSDAGSGAKENVKFYVPQKGGWYCVGVIATNVSGSKVSGVMVKGVEGVDIAKPVSYQQIYNDGGSGKDLNYQLWRPVAPQGFISLSDLPNFGTNYSNGNKNWDSPFPETWCIAAKYCKETTVGSQIWNDAGSGPYGWKHMVHKRYRFHGC